MLRLLKIYLLPGAVLQSVMIGGGYGTGRELVEFFTPARAERPEIYGGFAWAHWGGSDEAEQRLGELKITVRCIPLEGEEEPGRCVVTGEPSPRRVLLARAY